MFLAALCDDELDKSVKKVIKENADKGVKFVDGDIIINHEKSSALFKPVISEIVNHLRQHLHEPELRKVEYIFLVGGFSECLVYKKKSRRPSVETD